MALREDAGSPTRRKTVARVPGSSGVERDDVVPADALAAGAEAEGQRLLRFGVDLLDRRVQCIGPDDAACERRAAGIGQAELDPRRGDVDTGPEGQVRYRFADLEAEAEALEDERARASETEARLGKVVFASDE